MRSQDVENINDLVASLWASAKQNCMMNENFCPVAFFFFPDEDGNTAFGVFPLDMADKDLVSVLVKKIADQVGAFGVMLVCEAWVVDESAPPEELQRVMSGEISCRESKYRIEALNAMFETRKGGKLYSAKIDRSSGSKMLVNEKIRPMPEATGRFCNFLRADVTTH
jgi:hypothetical protein